MQDLSARYNPPGDPMRLLVPSSQEGGNLIQEDLAESTMTAPGSEPVSPLPPALEGAHPVPNQSGPRIEVSHPGQQPRPRVLPADDGSGRFRDDRMGRIWKQSSTGVNYG